MFACFLKTNSFSANHEKIIRELQNHFDIVFVPYATVSGQPTNETPFKNVFYAHRDNHALADFALYWSILKNIPKDNTLQSICLVNDSFDLVKTFQKSFTSEHLFYGFTKSYEKSGPYANKPSRNNVDTEHVQS